MKIIERNATVYKVVTERQGRLLSAMSFWLHRSWVVEYRPRRWTVSVKKGTALFAYALPPAFKISGNEQLWRATADIVDGELGHGGHVFMTRLYDQARSLAAFWRHPTKHLHRDEVEGVWCKRIRLEEMVSPMTGKAT